MRRKRSEGESAPMTAWPGARGQGPAHRVVQGLRTPGRARRRRSGRELWRRRHGARVGGAIAVQSLRRARGGFRRQRRLAVKVLRMPAQVAPGEALWGEARSDGLRLPEGSRLHACPCAPAGAMPGNRPPTVLHGFYTYRRRDCRSVRSFWGRSASSLLCGLSGNALVFLGESGGRGRD